MSVGMRVEAKVKRLPKGKPISLQTFLVCGSEPAVRSSLSRLVKSGKLVNIARGVYARPKPNRFFGTSLPGPEEVARVIAKASGERMAPHGGDVARRLGLSTQAPVQTAFYTSGRTRRIKVGNTSIYFEHAPERLVKHPNSSTGRALLALHHLGRQHTTPEMLRALNRRVPIQDLIRAENTPALLRARLAKLESAAVAA